MKIGFDISQTCESKSGTGFFADQMIQALSQIDQENQYTLLPWFYDYRPQTLENATEIRQKNFDQKIVKKFNDEEIILRQQDIVHSNNFRFPKDISAKKVVTLYDVCFLDYPEYTTEANRLFCYKGTLDSMLFADKIIAISQYTKERLLHFFPTVDERKVEVIYCGNRDTLLNERIDEKIIHKFNLIQNEYFLAVGTIEPRKNYGTLLKAYKIYKNNRKQYKKLCIAGGYGWLQDNFKKDIIDLGLTEDIVITDYVSETELSNPYRFSFAFVYPTWYEGFGLPVLEAMNFGKPVIASNVTSIPEIVGQSELLIKPECSDQIALCMEQIENDEELYRHHVERNYARVKEFSWQKSAQQLKDIYMKLL